MGHFVNYSLIIVLCMCLAACEENQPPQQTSRVIKIGLLVDLGIPGGLPTVNAAKMFEAEFNRAGGFDDSNGQKQLTIVIEDTLFNGDSAVEAARRLIFEHKVDAIIGPNTSRSAYPASAVAESAGVLMISPGATSAEIDKDKKFVFRIASSNAAQGRLMAKFARHELKASTATVLYNINNPSSRSVTESFIETFTALNGELIASIVYTENDTEFDQLVAKVIASKSDLVLLPNTTRSSSSQIKLLKSAGFQGKILGSDAWSPLIAVKGDTFEGAIYLHHWHSDFAFSNVKANAFLNSYLYTYEEMPTSMAALTFDAFALLTMAVDKSTNTGISLVEALKTIDDFNGVVGRLDFTQPSEENRLLVIEVRDRKNHIYQSGTWALNKSHD
jgi:branched-chain amino acid transport system substrate-binding protein